MYYHAPVAPIGHKSRYAILQEVMTAASSLPVGQGQKPFGSVTRMMLSLNALLPDSPLGRTAKAALEIHDSHHF